MPTSVRRPVILNPLSRSSFSTESNIVYVPNSQQRSNTAKSVRKFSPEIHSFGESGAGKGTTTNKLLGCNKFVLIGSIVALALLVLVALTLAIALPLLLTPATRTTTTVSTTKTSTTVTSTTTTAPCISPSVRAPSGACVSLYLDSQNCGSFGTTCAGSSVHCSAGVCTNTVPSVQLSNPTPIWIGGYDGSVDDEIYNISLPFPITLYATVTNGVQVTTNGVLCFSGCSNAHQATNLPSNRFSGITVFAYWDDLAVASKTWQGIYFAVTGTAPSRVLTFEYYLSYLTAPTNYTHFQISFLESSPNYVRITYFELDRAGFDSTIGIQASATGPSVVYSYSQSSPVTSNMVLSFTTNPGAVTVG